jgi:FlaA1/EpsC-like NDP-sugar epimerase
MLTLHAIKVPVVVFTKADSQILRDIENVCRERDVCMNILPMSLELMTGSKKLSNPLNLSDEDLLGRRSIKFNEEALTTFLNNKRALITGTGSSIGSEIASQVNLHHPAKGVYAISKQKPNPATSIET